MRVDRLEQPQRHPQRHSDEMKLACYGTEEDRGADGANTEDKDFGKLGRRCQRDVSTQRYPGSVGASPSKGWAYSAVLERTGEQRGQSDFPLTTLKFPFNTTCSHQTKRRRVLMVDLVDPLVHHGRVQPSMGKVLETHLRQLIGYRVQNTIERWMGGQIITNVDCVLDEEEHRDLPSHLRPMREGDLMRFEPEEGGDAVKATHLAWGWESTKLDKNIRKKGTDARRAARCKSGRRGRAWRSATAVLLWGSWSNRQKRRLDGHASRRQDPEQVKRTGWIFHFLK